LFLIRDALRQVVQLTAEVFDLPASRLALLVVHLCCSRPGQSLLGAADEGRSHLQIAQQCGDPSRGALRFGLRLGFEK